MTHREAFIAAIKDAPEDPTPKLVFADFLDDEGEYGEAEAWRWLGAWRLNPRRAGVRGFFGWYVWHHYSDAWMSDPDRDALPFDVFDALDANHKTHGLNEFSYTEHLEHVVAAFLKKRAAGWTPTWPEKASVDP